MLFNYTELFSLQIDIMNMKVYFSLIPGKINKIK